MEVTRHGLMGSFLKEIHQLRPWPSPSISAFSCHGKGCEAKAKILKLWSADQQSQHHLGAYYKCNSLGPTPKPLNQKLWGEGPGFHVNCCSGESWAWWSLRATELVDRGLPRDASLEDGWRLVHLWYHRSIASDLNCLLWTWQFCGKVILVCLSYCD